MQITTDIRKQLGEKARTERDKAVAKEEAARKALLEVVASDSCNIFSAVLAIFPLTCCSGTGAICSPP